MRKEDKAKIDAEVERTVAVCVKTIQQQIGRAARIGLAAEVRLIADEIASKTTNMRVISDYLMGNAQRNTKGEDHLEDVRASALAIQNAVERLLFVADALSISIEMLNSNVRLSQTITERITDAA